MSCTLVQHLASETPGFNTDNHISLRQQPIQVDLTAADMGFHRTAPNCSIPIVPIMVDAATSTPSTPVNGGTEPPSSSTLYSPSEHPKSSPSHIRPRSSHGTSSTAVQEQGPSQVLGSGEAHAHLHPSGTCCSSSEASSEISWLNDLGATEDNSHDHDVERGPPNYERVVLLVNGLQCGCCEGGISRTVSRIAAIRNHTLNVVLARLTFDLDTNRLSVNEVIKRLSTKTGYSFEEHVAHAGQVLEIVTSTGLVPVLPVGVNRVEFLERQPWMPTLSVHPTIPRHLNV